MTEDPGRNPSRNRLQTRTLLDAITEHRFDAVFGGARRDEEKARAKERVFSFRDEFGQWDPKNQRPELWGLYNGRHRTGEHIRVFPLSDWTELDIWQYIAQEDIEIPSIYFAHRREVFRRDGMLLSVGPYVSRAEDEEPFEHRGALPDGGRHDLHGRGRVQRRDRDRDHRRDGRDPDHRAGRHPGRRQVQRGRHGGPQAGGLLLAMELLRFATAGSVDDGKSTLIGRLLYDSKAIFEDQLEAVERVSRQRGDEYTDLALLTDGLRAEREQGITIDVAYRYFATPLRKFIIADTPGHVQYTRNMVTGNSTADLTLVLVDARKGIVEQTKRHAFLAIAAAGAAPARVRQQDGPGRLRRGRVRADPGGVQGRSPPGSRSPTCRSSPSRPCTGTTWCSAPLNMAWYQGPSLLHHLEQVYIASDRNLIDPRLPVQWVVRPTASTVPDYRGYAGTVAGGVFRPGDEVTVLPSGLTTTIAAIDTFDGPVEEAFAPMSVMVRLAEDLDVSRGDVICRPHNQPTVGQDIDAMVCWMIERPLGEGDVWRSSTPPAGCGPWCATSITASTSTPCTGTNRPTSLRLNEVGRVSLRVTQPLFYDSYRRNRSTGSFILVAEDTNVTCGAGMILGPD